MVDYTKIPEGREKRYVGGTLLEPQHEIEVVLSRFICNVRNQLLVLRENPYSEYSFMQKVSFALEVISKLAIALRKRRFPQSRAEQLHYDARQKECEES